MIYKLDLQLIISMKSSQFWKIDFGVQSASRKSDCSYA